MNFEIPAPLLSWMADESSDNNRRLYGWDMIIGLPLELVNAALQHNGLQRLAVDQGVEGLGGEILIQDSRQKYELAGYRLSNLAVQVAATNYGNPNVKVSAVLEGGAQIRTEGLGSVLTLSEHPPYSGIDAGLELPITYREGKLGASLKDGVEHELAVGTGEVIKKAAAELFKEMLLDLETPRAQLRLAQVQASDDNPLRQVARMELRTQIDGNTHVAAGETPPSNVLLFVNFAHGGPVDFPRGGDTFPYLLGSDGAGGQGCTALLSRHLLHRVAFGQSIMASLQGGRYDYGESSTQPLPRITVDQGEMPIPGGLHDGGYLTIAYEAFTLDATTDAQLQVAFEPDRAIQTWRPRCRIEFRYQLAGSEAWTTHSVVVQPQLNYSLQLKGAGTAGELLEGWWLAAATEPALIEHLPEELPTALQDEMASALEHIVRAAYLQAVNARPLINVAEQLLPFLRLFDTDDLRWQVGATPNNLVVVGAFDKAEGQFRIEQQEAQLKAGQPFTFTLQPPRPGVKWRVEALPGTPSIEGMEETSGVYTPPAIAGNWRIKVVAEDPVTRMSSSALVSVSTVRVMMGPLFKHLVRGHEDVGEQVRFVASSMEQGAAEYQWDVEGEEGVKGTFAIDGDTSVAVYTPGPKQEGRTYVIDRVVTTNTVTQDVRLGLVLSQHGDPELEIWPGAEVTDKGLKLEAWLGESEEPLENVVWTVEGPGEVVDDHYRPDPDAADAFVLIIGTFEYKNHLYQGHLVRPLPLDRFPGLSAAQAMRKRHRQRAGARRLSIHQEGTPTFDLLPKGPLAVGPGHKVKFKLSAFKGKKVSWRVERVSGDQQMRGQIDAEGGYTAGKTDTGSDRVIADLWLLGSKVGTAVATIINVPDMPVWDSLKSFDLKASNFNGDAHIYGNGHMQVEVGIEMAAEGIELQIGEVDSVRLFSKATHLQLPEQRGPLPKQQALWAFNRDRNAYDLAGSTQSAGVQGPPVILAKKQYYLLSRAAVSGHIDCYAGLQDRHGAWHYSNQASVVGNPEIKVKVIEHTVRTDDFLLSRTRIRPDRRGNEDEDFDLVLDSVDYWKLTSKQERKFFKVKVMTGAVALANARSEDPAAEPDPADPVDRDSIVLWEDDHDQVATASYTGWAFWSAENGTPRPKTMKFHVDGLSELLPKPKSSMPDPAYLGEDIEAGDFAAPGLIIGNFRVDEYYYSEADKKYVEPFKKSLLYRLQDSQGNTVDLWVSYDTDHESRYRDFLIVKEAKPGDEW